MKGEKNVIFGVRREKIIIKTHLDEPRGLKLQFWFNFSP